MAIKLKRSSTPGSVPDVSSLELGELALNTYDGTIYLKKNQSGTEEIVSFTQSGFPTSDVGYLYDDGAGNLTWQVVDQLSNGGSSTLTWQSGNLIYDSGFGGGANGQGPFSIEEKFGNASIGWNTGGSDQNFWFTELYIGSGGSFYFYPDGRIKTPKYQFPGVNSAGGRQTLIDPYSPSQFANLEWGYPAAISNGTSTVYIDGSGNVQLPAGTDIFDSTGAVYRGVNVQDDTVPVSSSSYTLNFGTGLVVSVDPGTNITSIGVDDALSNVSTLNVSGDISIGGNFTATGAIFAIGTVYSNGVPTLTSQFQADWTQADEASPAFINNKPTLITTILYTKQLNYVGTVDPQEGTLRWYPDSNIVITSVFVNASIPPTTSNLQLDVKKNGTSFQTVTLDIGEYKSTAISLSESLTSNDYITVDVITGGLAAFATLTISYTRVA
jgi:hypothetical protein